MQEAPVTNEQFTAYLDEQEDQFRSWGILEYGDRGRISKIHWASPREAAHLESVRREVRMDQHYRRSSSMRQILEERRLDMAERRYESERNREEKRSMDEILSEVDPNVSRLVQMVKLVPSHREFLDRFKGIEKGASVLLRLSHPVVMVTWHEAATYAYLKGGRLPTEAEWEFAARAGREGDYVYATDTGKLTKNNAHWNHSGEQVATATVKSFKPNPWGLYDMTGNVWEWVSDWYARDYGRSPAHDPFCANAQKGWRVMRGHAWSSDDPHYMLVANRFFNEPDGRSEYIGFRMVR